MPSTHAYSDRIRDVFCLESFVLRAAGRPAFESCTGRTHRRADVGAFNPRWSVEQLQMVYGRLSEMQNPYREGRTRVYPPIFPPIFRNPPPPTPRNPYPHALPIPENPYR